MAIKALTTIRHNGQIYKPGEIIEKIDPKSELRLIKLGDAEKIKIIISKEDKASREDKKGD